MKHIHVIAWLAIGVAMFSSTGCYRTVLNTPAPRSGIEGEESGVSWFGLTPVTHRADECPKGIAKVDASMPFWGALVVFLTAGVVAPMSIVYQCAGMPATPPASTPIAPAIE